MGDGAEGEDGENDDFMANPGEQRTGRAMDQIVAD